MRTLYHGTSSVNLDCIKTVGLEPGHAKGGDAWAADHHMMVATLSKKREPSVFVAATVTDAEDFAHYSVEEIGGKPIVIVLHVPEEVFATFVPDELYSESGTHKAWRAHSVAVSCIGEVKPVTSEPPVSLGDIRSLLAALLSLHHH